jgi:hypothetical protein
MNLRDIHIFFIFLVACLNSPLLEILNHITLFDLMSHNGHTFPKFVNFMYIEDDNASRIGAPPVGAPGVGAPPVGAPPVGAPAVGAPAVGAPGVGAPEVDIPLLDAPGVGAPEVDIPLLDAPGVGAALEEDDEHSPPKIIRRGYINHEDHDCLDEAEEAYNKGLKYWNSLELLKKETINFLFFF